MRRRPSPSLDGAVVLAPLVVEESRATALHETFFAASEVRASQFVLEPMGG